MLRPFFLTLLFLAFSCNAQVTIDDYNPSKENRALLEAERFSDPFQFAKALILKSSVDRPVYYNNDIVLVKWELLYPNVPNLNINYLLVDYHVPTLPSLAKEFTVTPSDKDSLNTRGLTINGTKYRAQTLLAFYLSTMGSTGNFTIGEGDVSIQLYDSNGGYVGKPLTIKSSPVSFNVKNLQKKPSAYSGAIGKFSIKAELIPNGILQVGKSSTLRVTVSGIGNLKFIGSPQLKMPKSIEYYPLKSSSNIKYDYKNCSGERIFDFVVIPQSQLDGDDISASFNYYDLSKKQFVDVKSNSLRINVIPSQEKQQAVGPNNSPNKESTDSYSRWLIRIPFAICCIVLVVLCYYLIFKKRRGRKQTSNLISCAKKQVSQLRDEDDVYTQSYVIVKDLITGLCSRNNTIQNDELLELCRSNNFPNGYISKLDDFFKICEQCRYSHEVGVVPPSDVLKKANDLIDEVKNYV